MKRERGRRDVLSRSMSATVTCWVPEIHCMLLMVGRGGMRSSGFKSMSLVRLLVLLLVKLWTVVKGSNLRF